MKISDEHAAAVIALELGALVEQDADEAQRRRDSLTNEARCRIVDAIRAQHELHRAKLDRALQDLATQAPLLSLTPILTPAPREAERAQRRALGAVSVREGLHRLEGCASLLGAPPVAPLVESRRDVDMWLRKQLPSWVSIAPWRARFAADLRLDDARCAARWWMTAWPTDESLELADDEADLDAITAWIGGRLVAGRLALTREEATALLSTESGRRLAEDLADRLDFSSLEQASSDAPSRASERWRGVTPDLRRLVDALASVPATPQAEYRLAAATRDDAPIAKGFAALTRFRPDAASFVHGIGVVATGSIARGGGGTDPCRAVLAIPGANVRSLGIDGQAPIARAEWEPGGVAWPLAIPASIAFRVQDADVDAIVPVSLSGAPQIDELVVVLRAIATASLPEVLGLLSSFEQSGDEDTREACKILRGVVAPSSP